MRGYKLFGIITLSLILLLVLLMAGCSKNSSSADDDDDIIDSTPPSTIADLTEMSVTTSSVLLQWTAPGDDDTSGIASAYDLRVSLDSIRESNFSEAYRIDSVDAPLPSGYVQNFLVEGLTEGTEYFFAIKSCDEESNWSGMSNCISATCLTDLVVTFPDTALEHVIRETIDLPTGDIHISDLQGMTDLIAEERGIEDLSGLEYCPDIHWLLLPGNNISDITPLQNMISLYTISLMSNNVTDLTPLTNLTNLIQLHLGENPIDDIAALAGLGNLQLLRLNSTQVRDFSPVYGLDSLVELDLSADELADISFIMNFTHVKRLTLTSNGISDLTPIGNLTQLEDLALFNNQISDISALSLLVNINFLSLPYNQISDLLPLVNNSGLGSGDNVFLQNNPLSQQSIDEYIPALEARGVTVYR